MKVLFDAMKQQGVSNYRDLDASKARELVGYVQDVAAFRRSDTTLAKPALVGSVWRLALTSTETALPRDATVSVQFQTEQTLRYSLSFGKRTLGLNRLDAISSWTMSDNNNGVQFVYDKITMDAFGLNNVDVCFFGLLKGRSNGIETAYFDGDVWIEEQPTRDDSDAAPSNLAWNVYVREKDDWRK